MKHKHQLQKTVGILMIVFLIAGLAALPALAGVTEGNSGKTGQTIDVKRFVKPGQTTIIDFYSRSCPPCMKLAPMLDAMAAKRPKTQVVKLNIDRPGAQGIDFDSPLAKQYNITGIPHMMVFDENGALKAQGREALTMVLEWCR
jgi:thiol-disulfide isomerase/thioredoxin